MADDQQLSAQDIKDLQEISPKLPPGHPTQKKISLLLSSQPTQFEKDRPGSGISLQGAGSAALDTLKSMIPPDPTGGNSLLSKEAWLGTGPKIDPKNSGIAQMGKEASAEYKRARAAGTNPVAAGYSAAISGAGPLAGVSDLQQQAQAERGEGGKIIGESAVPAMMATAPLVAPLVGEGLLRGRTLLQNAAYRELPTKGAPQLTPGATTVGRLGGIAAGHVTGIPFGGELAGFALGPNLLKAILGKPELGDIRNPGSFSKIPARVPKGPKAPSGGAIGEGRYGASVPAVQDSLIVTPEEAATGDQLQQLAKRRASERGMQYAGGMREPMYVKQARAVLEDVHSTAKERAVAARVLRGATR
jgi:hypothetical protein